MTCVSCHCLVGSIDVPAICVERTDRTNAAYCPACAGRLMGLDEAYPEIGDAAEMRAALADISLRRRVA